MVPMFCTLRQAADKLKTTEADLETMVSEGVLREYRDGPTRLVKVADLAALAGSVAGPQQTADATPATAGARKKKARAAGPAGQTQSVTGSSQVPVAVARRERTRAQSPRRARVPAPVSAAASSAETDIKLPSSAAAPIRRNVRRRPDNPVQSVFTADDRELERYFGCPGVEPSDRLDAYHTIASERPPAQTARRMVPPARRPGSPRRNPAPVFRTRRPKPQTHELSLKDWIWTGLIDDRPHTILVLLGMVLVGAVTVIGIGYLLTQML